MKTIQGFTRTRLETSRGSVAAWSGGSGPAVLLLHGFPQTSLMWRSIAPLLARDFTVVAADLPGYGDSDCPPDWADHASMSKRELATTLVHAMRGAGHDRFAVVGHDRGGRVAYRAALDHPDAVTAVAVLDVIPTAEVWDRADARVFLSYWPFALLAQPSPFPERLLAADPAAFVDNALSAWGTPAEVFPAAVRDAYIHALRDPARAHAICEEYRAAAGIDREIDHADRASGRRITAPLLALWSDSSGLAEWYDSAGGPLGIWGSWADDVRGRAVPGGHFFPEEHPESTALQLGEFLRAI